MNLIRFAMITTLTVLLLGVFVQDYCFAADSARTYWLLDHPDGFTHYQLTVSVTSYLYEYYRSKDHTVLLYEFAKFVTPYALKPVADSLWSIYNDDEDFANGVLMLVHQIPYEVSEPQKYPVETIVENKGDCDLFSFIAASVMMAGGLDVVLLLYEEQGHMNVGVHLSHAPNDARSTVCYFSVNDKRYYMAETTGGEWESGWRVGECPDLLKGASAHVITLEDAEQVSPGQVSSSYSAPTASSITLSLSSDFIVEGNPIIISGSITPPHSNKSVTIYVRGLDDAEWIILKTVLSDSNGQYSYVWSPNSAKTYYISASWSGDADHSGANSNTQTLNIIPINWILITIISIMSVTVAIVIFVVSRRSRIPQQNQPIPSEN